MGQDAHVLTFPIQHGATLNMFACRKNFKPWPSNTNLVLPATQEEALEDFKHFGPPVRNMIKMTRPDLDRVS
jgi:salicylate hydroxylase